MAAEHLAEGIAADYDVEGQLAGIELLDAAKRFGSKETFSYPAGFVGHNAK